MKSDEMTMITELTPEGLLVGTEVGTGRVLCAIPAVRGPRYAIAPVPRSRRKARAVMVPRGVSWAVSPLGIVLVLQHEDTASRCLTGLVKPPSPDVIEQAHPGLRVEYLARLGDWAGVQELLLQQPSAMQWVHAARTAQLSPVPGFGPGEHPSLVTLRELVDVLPARRAAQRALHEVLTDLDLHR